MARFRISPKSNLSWRRVDSELAASGLVARESIRLICRHGKVAHTGLPRENFNWLSCVRSYEMTSLQAGPPELSWKRSRVKLA